MLRRSEQPNAGVGIGATNLQPIEILVGNCAGISVQFGDKRDHTRRQGLGGTSSQLGCLDKQWRNDHLLMQRQLTPNLVEQLDRLPS
jgi:hypothetical protein